MDRAEKFVHGRGAWMAFFAFIPILGSAISIVLGMMRANIWIVILAMTIGKVLRYALLVWGVLEASRFNEVILWNWNRQQTASYTLYVPELDEHYHSVKGALTESQHIFIEMGLKHSPVAEPRILEIGLGTGLNAFLTLLTAEEIRKKVYYTGIERYPLSEDTVHKLNYPGLIGKGHGEDYYAIHNAGWGNGRGTLSVVHTP